MSDFKDKQLAFLINLAYELKVSFGAYRISVSELIVENFNEFGSKYNLKDNLSEKLKEEFSKKVQNGEYKKEKLFDDGFEVLDPGAGTTMSIRVANRETLIKRETIVTTLKLKAKLFLSFLLNEEKKQKLIEEIITKYSDEPYKRETTYDDEELLQLLEWVC